MAGETTLDSSYAVQLTECCIPGSLLDVDESSEELNTCEILKDEKLGQENELDIDNLSNKDNTGHSVALEKSKEVAILQKLQNDVGNFSNDSETDKRQESTETMRTQHEDPIPTKDKDSITKEEHDEKVVIVSQKAEGSNYFVNQKMNNDSKSCNEDGTIGIPKDEAVDVAEDDKIIIFCSQKQEIIAQKIEESSSEINQKQSFNADVSVGILKDEAVDITTDYRIKVFEVNTEDRRDCFDQIETVEPCERPSLNELVEEHDGKFGFTVEDTAREEEVIVTQKAEGSNAMINQMRNNDSKSCNEDGTIGILKDEAVDITADDKINVFEVDTRERRDSFDQIEDVEPCGSPSLHKTAEEHDWKDGTPEEVELCEDGTIGMPKEEAVDITTHDQISVFEEDTKERMDSFDQMDAVEPCGSPSLHETVNFHDNLRQEEEVDESSQKEKVITAQKIEESNPEEIQKRSKDFIGLRGDGSIGIPKDKVDIDIDIAADDETMVFEVGAKERMDLFNQTEAVEPCGNPSLHEPEGIFNEIKENDANGTFATSSQDQDSAEAQNISFQMVPTEGDPSSLCAKDAIAENIHQGELLLYRLQLVQQNQELQQVSDGPSASNTAAIVTTNDTVNSVTLRPGTAGKDEDSIQENKCQKEQSQEEVVDTSSAGIGEDKQVKMGKENIRRPQEETPIQREIRQGLEREKSLRRSRGLDDLENKSAELVEIPVMRFSEVPDQSSDTINFMNVERRLAKRKMLQDINQEAMKEQAVKKLGKVPGLYEEGYAQGLKERRMLFEAFQQCKKMDVQGSSRGRKLLSSSFTAKNTETTFVRRLERTRSLDFFTNHHLKDSTCLSIYHRGESRQNDIDSQKDCQIKNLEDDATSASSHETQTLNKSLRPSISSSSLDCSSGMMLSVQDNRKENEEGSVLKGKNPFFQLRPSLSLRPDMEKEIREAMERELELRRLRSRLYGEQWNRPRDQQEQSNQSPCPQSASTLSTDCVYRGKLTLIWPPPHSKLEEEPGPPNPTGQRSAPQHYWESGMVNTSCSEKD